MFKFLRRVFIILVLLIVAFFIFRLIKPEATNRFVEKIKNIPTTISSRFNHKDSEVIINGNTTYSTGNFEINTGKDTNKTTDIESSGTIDGNNENKSLVWLDELNKEIENVLSSQKDQGNEIQVEFYESTETGNNNTPAETGNNNVTIETQNETQTQETQEKKKETNNNTNSNTSNSNNSDNTNNTNNTQNTNTSNTNQNTSTILTDEQRGSCAKKGLSIRDCEDLFTDLGNLNFN